MAFEQRDGQFSLFKNESHEPGDNKPTLKGRGMWKGELIEFAVWTKERAGGEKYFSGKMQEPKAKVAPVEDHQNERPAPAKAQTRSVAETDDFIPF